MTEESIQQEAAMTAVSIRPLVADVVEQAKSIAVVDAATRLLAVEHGRDMLQREMVIKEKFEEPKKLAKAAYESIRDLEAEALAKLTEAKKVYAAKISAYDVEQKRLRDIAEEARQAEIRRIEAERARVESEAKAKAARAEEEYRLNHAIESERNGNGNGDKLLATPTPVPEFAPIPVIPVVHSAPAVPEKQNGTVGRQTWTYKVVDIRAFVKAVADGVLPMELLISEEDQKDFRSAGLRSFVTAQAIPNPGPGIEATLEHKTAFKLNEK